jgi:hypothetical protein
MAPLNVIQSSVPFLSKVPMTDLKADDARTDNILCEHPIAAPRAPPPPRCRPRRAPGAAASPARNGARCACAMARCTAPGPARELAE